jgi:hypothetical protein
MKDEEFSQRVESLPLTVGRKHPIINGKQENKDELNVY